MHVSFPAGRDVGIVAAGAGGDFLEDIAEVDRCGFLVPFAAGGLTDTVARTLQPRLSEGLGQQVVVDNRPGAAGLLGAELIAKSPADGYSIMIHSASFTTSVAVQPRLSFDPVRDFTAITPLADTPMLMTVNAGVQAKNVQEWIALARAKEQ